MRRCRPVLIAVTLVAAWPAMATAAPPCAAPDPDGHEPPCNPALSSAEWGASHRANYAQASSPFPGPRPGQPVLRTHLSGVTGVPIVISFTDAYPDGGGRAAWLSTVSMPDARAVYKLDVATGRIIDTYNDVVSERRGPGGPGGISGAYSVLDADGHLIVGRGRSLDVYGDARPGEHGSPIALLRRFVLPDTAFCRPQDRLVGITMLHDGHVAFATERGSVGVVRREPDAMAGSLRTLSLNGTRCADASIPIDELETVSNSIAADEQGGIYVVTDAAMHRVDLRDGALHRAWTGAYETGAGSGVRLGDGSGATPTLMGTHPGDDRLVVITDGQDLMHLVLMWRDEIPADWPGLPGKDRRIACEVPVTFGDPDAKESLSEQSVMVRGNAAVVVNNKLGTEAIWAGLPYNIVTAPLAGQDPVHAPYGIERIDWDPATRTCAPVWANRELSIPNGIPTMSADTGLIYGWGQRAGVFGLEGISFADGTSELFVPSSPSPEDNSFYAATTIGPGGSIWTGTFLGATILRPLAVP